MNNIKKMSTANGLVIIAAIVIVIAGLSAAKVIVVPFLLSAFIAIISTGPLVWLQSKGVSKWFALLVVVFLVFIIGVLVTTLIGVSIKDFSANIPVYEIKFKEQIDIVTQYSGKIGIDISGLALTEVFNVGAAMKLVALLLNGLGNVLANGFLILMTVIFMLLESSKFFAKVSMISCSSKKVLIYSNKFIDNIKHYMAIKTLISFCTGIIVTIFLLVLKIDYPFLWGLLAFLLNYVPNVGSIIAILPPLLLAIIQYGFVKAVVVIIGYVVINLFMGNIIEPRLMGKGLGLSPLVVFLSLVFWGWVLGPIGMLLSVPLTVTLKIAFDSRDETNWIAVLLG